MELPNNRAGRLGNGLFQCMTPGYGWPAVLELAEMLGHDMAEFFPRSCGDGPAIEWIADAPGPHCAPCWWHVFLHQLPSDDCRQLFRDIEAKRVPHPCTP